MAAETRLQSFQRITGMIKRCRVLVCATTSTPDSSVINGVMAGVALAGGVATSNLPMVNIDDEPSKSRVIQIYPVGAHNRTHNEFECYRIGTLRRREAERASRREVYS